MRKARKQVLTGENEYEAEEIDIDDEFVLDDEVLPGFDDNMVDN